MTYMTPDELDRALHAAYARLTAHGTVTLGLTESGMESTDAGEIVPIEEGERPGALTFEAFESAVRHHHPLADGMAFKVHPDHVAFLAYAVAYVPPF